MSNVYDIFSAIYHPRFKLMVCGESWHHAELSLLRLIHCDINSLATTWSDSPFLNNKIALANYVCAIFSAVNHPRVKITVCAESWHHAELSLLRFIYCDINSLATTRAYSPILNQKIALANYVYAIFSAVYHPRVKIMVCAESWHHAELSLFRLIYCDINGLATTRSESPFLIKNSCRE